MPPLVVVSNRGPVSFKSDDQGQLIPTRGGGGLVASLVPAVEGISATWITSAVTDEDRRAATGGPVQLDNLRIRYVTVEPPRYRQYYDVIANGTLWFMHHNIFDLARRPYIDQHWWEAWNTYTEVNELFAQTVAEESPEGATVLVHDYHLTLLGKWLREKRPDLNTIHFHHTPFAGRNSVNILPPPVAQAVLEGLAGHNACGFHSPRWAESFATACQDHLGYKPNTFVSAAAIDNNELRQVAASAESRHARERLDAIAGDRKLIVRVDRIELSKNLLRGFAAYDDMLRKHPEWRERVTFAAFVYPSREGLADYLAYRNEMESVVDRINEEWATPDWSPIVLHMRDSFPDSVAALTRYDVLLVNPVRDGLNLVAKEGAMLNEHNGVIVLSREAGSWQELKESAIGINPFDIVGTSDALAAALEMSDEERSRRAEQSKRAALERTPRDWLDDQLRAAGVDA